MKTTKFILTLLVISFSSLLHAQKGFEIGAGFQYQSTWLVNNDDWNEGPSLDVEKTFHTAYGLNLGYGFSGRHGIRVGAFMSEVGQKYIGAIPIIQVTVKSETTIKYLQIPVLYRYTSDLTSSNTAFLLTVGPQFGLLQEATSTASANLLGIPGSTGPIDLKKSYNDMDISAHLGVGIIARFSPKFHMNAQLNFAYSLQDIENSSTKIPNRAITRNGVVGLGVSFYYLIGGTEMSKIPKMK